ncbi:flagellar basal body L-ring protein FlgH [Sphingomonas sp. ac-8]|uniref:flagellar basal body L-ring protein FlgH n=1 Tax=Sphingomonas sp. ac-8 TaxID=3242977 RepID=UPI003A7FE754
MNKTLPLLIVAGAALSGCGTVGNLKMVGKAPPLSEVGQVDAPYLERSLGEAGATQRRTAMTPPGAVQTPSASLFRAGAGAFLGDQRAASVGDILTIRINIADRAEVGNSTSRSRAGSENASVASLLGLQKLLPGNGTNLASTNSQSQNSGGGNISRSETINMTMSAIVTNVLPNGNLAIRGRQEVRVNYELRELIVTGLVRPQDISRDNSIAHSQIAEARISYGGRGQLSSAQQARWGQQIYDALFPF